MEKLNENLPKEFTETDFSLGQYEDELELDTEGASEWLFGQDIIQTIGVAVGFCLFLLVCGGSSI